MGARHADTGLHRISQPAQIDEGPVFTADTAESEEIVATRGLFAPDGIAFYADSLIL
ncbi:MAG: hypothetical protein GVY13_11095 [Alphaproteobacteria bacterium]|jgi:hypothetical protein|nr:hypothetical protein [Alphaproteobacteria bacterium]